MKYFTSLLLCFAALFSRSQSLPMKEGKVIYELIDSVSGNTKGQLFTKANLWASDTFRNSKNATRVDDKEAGELAGKGAFQFGAMGSNHCRFAWKVSTRDGKYRAQIYDITLQQGTAGAEKEIEKLIGDDGSGKKKMQENMDEEFKKLLADLQVKMNAASDTF